MPPQTLIRRPALADRLRRAAERGPIVLVAGAGFGKTLALEEALAGLSSATAWVRCEPGDREVGPLIKRTLDVIDRTLPGAIAGLAGRLLGTSPYEAGWTLAEELAPALVEPLVIVFDDAEHVADAPQALAFVASVMSASISRLRVAAASRRPLDLPSDVPDALTTFGPDDLGFTRDEIAGLVELHRGFAPAQDEIQAILEATVGWPLGVALESRFGRRPGGGDADLGRRTLAEYLDEEILERLAAATRRALLTSAIVDEISPRVVAALGLPEGFVETASELAAPLVRVEQGRARWHPVMRDALRERVTESIPPEELRALHARVADAVLADGRVVEAIQHLVEAAHWDRVLALLDRQGGDLVMVSPGLVGGWLERLPPQLRAAPAAQLLAGRCLGVRGLRQESVAPLSAALEGFRCAGDRERDWFTRRVLVDTFVSHGQLERAVRLADGFDAVRGGTAGALAVTVALAAVWCLELLGDDAGAKTLADRARTHPDAPAVPHLFEVRRAQQEYLSGKIDDALERLDAAAADSDPRDSLQSFAVQIIRSRILTDILDDRRLGSEIQALERQSREHGYLMPGLRIQQALALAVSGDHHAAERAVRSLERQPNGLLTARTEAATALVAYARGQADVAAVACERAWDAARPLASDEVVTTALIIVPVALAAGRREWADAVLGEATRAWAAAFGDDRGRYLRARLTMLAAWAAHVRTDIEEAERLLLQCWRDSEGFRGHVLRPEWPRARPLLWHALGSELLDPAEAVAAVQAAFRDPGPALLGFLRHPHAGARAAAFRVLLDAGHPEVLRRTGEFVDEHGRAVAPLAAVRREPPPIEFSVLGGFAVRRAGWPVPDSAWRRPMAARLVRVLLAQRPGPVPAQRLFEALWPERDHETARRNLRVAVSQARAVLDLPGTRDSVVRLHEPGYELVLTGRDRVDADEFEAVAAEALAAVAEDSRRDLLDQARSAWSGEPLPEDRYAAWAQPWRNRLIERYTEVLWARSQELEQVGNHYETIRVAHELLALDEFDERTHRLLMRANARAGRVAQALRQYLVCRRALVDELGIEPSETTRALHARILNREPV